MKSIKANLLKIESTTTTENFPGDTTGSSIIVTASASGEKGETAQHFGQPGLISNPSKGNIGLRISKGSLDIIVADINYSIPLPENPGESMLYSTDSEGNLLSKLFLDTDGNFVFNDGADNAVRYSELETGLDNFKTSIDTENTTETGATTTELASLATQINANLTLIATGIVALGGAYVPVPIVPGTVTSSAVSVDITPSKIEEIKVP